MKYEFGERAAFNALLPNQWIIDKQRMMYEDGNPTLSWFKKSFRDNDKYMSKLVNCKQEGESEHFQYKLAANLVLSKDNEQRFNIIERAKNIPLKDYFLSLK